MKGRNRLEETKDEASVWPERFNGGKERGGQLSIAGRPPQSTIMSKEEKLRYCADSEGVECRDNFHNGAGHKGCWHLPSARMVTKKVYLKTTDTRPERIKTLSCFRPLRR